MANGEFKTNGELLRLEFWFKWFFCLKIGLVFKVLVREKLHKFKRNGENEQNKYEWINNMKWKMEKKW